MGALTIVRRWLMASIAVGLVLLTSVPVAHAATPAPCRVRNVTQGTHGRSLIRMVERTKDGDRLLVRGTCHGEIVIDTDISLRGKGDAVLSGRDRTRVVRVERGARVTIRSLVIRRGARVEFGAGITNDGNLTLLDVIVKRNEARAFVVTWGVLGSGGGIANSGRLLLEDSAVRRNKAARSAGGIENWEGGWAILRRTTVTGNETTIQQDDPYGGGGIENSFGGQLRLVDSTVSNNRSLDNGGGIYNSGFRTSKATIIRSTISGNESSSNGGGIANEGILTLDSSTVSNNDSGGVGGGVHNARSVTLTDSTVSGNTAGEGGGIYNSVGPGSPLAIVTIDAASSVTGNVPDDCVGTPAC